MCVCVCLFEKLGRFMCVCVCVCLKKVKFGRFVCVCVCVFENG